MTIKVFHSPGIKVFYAGVVFETLWYFEFHTFLLQNNKKKHIFAIKNLRYISKDQEKL
jgi:hypothetical protein